MNSQPAKLVLPFDPRAARAIQWTFAPGVERIEPTDLDLNTLQSDGRVTLVKHGPHRTVYRVQLQTGMVYWKHCRIYSSRSFLRECVRPPKALLEFDKALALA